MGALMREAVYAVKAYRYFNQGSTDPAGEEVVGVIRGAMHLSDADLQAACDRALAACDAAQCALPKGDPMLRRLSQAFLALMAAQMARKERAYIERRNTGLNMSLM